MKFKQYKKIAYAALLASAGAVHAETGNSVVFNDPDNNRSIALDRIHLATLPAHERSALLGTAEEQLGEGRVMDKPESYGAFIVDRQQDSSGSLTEKTFDVEFAPLAPEPEISKAAPIRRESEGMEKTSEATGVYYVAVPGTWGASYGGESWRTPTNEYFKATGWRPATDASKIACTGATKYEYNKTRGYKAFWEQGPRWYYNFTAGIESDLGDVKFGTYGSMKCTFKDNVTYGTGKVDYGLWSNTFWDLEDGHMGVGTLIASYDEITTSTSHYIGYTLKVSASVNLFVTDNKLLSLKPSAYLEISAGHTTAFQNALRHRNVQDIGYSEASNSFTLVVETGFDVKVTLGLGSATAKVGLGYKYSQGTASGTRDFDTFCYAHDPQKYTHNGYKENQIYFRKEGKFTFETSPGDTVAGSVRTTRNLLTRVNPGRFLSTDAPELRGTVVDMKM